MHETAATLARCSADSRPLSFYALLQTVVAAYHIVLLAFTRRPDFAHGVKGTARPAWTLRRGDENVRRYRIGPCVYCSATPARLRRSPGVSNARAKERRGKHIRHAREGEEENLEKKANERRQGLVFE